MDNNDKLITFGKEIYKQFEGFIDKYLTIKGNIFENEHVQLAGDINQFVKIIQRASSLISKKRFESFLRGLSNGQPTEEQLKRLAEYINDEKKAEYIFDSISKILISRSNKACMLLGIILGHVLNENLEIDFNVLICMQSLPELLDYDVDNLVFLLKYLDDHEKLIASVSRCTKCSEYGSDFEQEVRNKGIEESSLLITIDKAIYHHLLTSVSLEDWGRTYELRVISPGKFLHQIIQKSKLV